MKKAIIVMIFMLSFMAVSGTNATVKDNKEYEELLGLCSGFKGISIDMFKKPRGCVQEYIDTTPDRMQACEKAIELNPNDPRPYDYLADHFLNIWAFPLAIEYYTKAIAFEKDRKELADLYSKRGYAHLLLDDFDSAVKDFQRALKITPDAFYKGNFKINIELTHKIMKLRDSIQSNPEEPRLYYELAKAYIELSTPLWEAKMGKLYEIARSLFRNIPPGSERDFWYLLIQGMINTERNDKQVALTMYEELIKLKPDEAVVYLHRSYAYDSIEIKQKLKDVRMALQLNPDYDEALYFLARLIEFSSDSGQPEIYEAINALTRLIKINPNYADDIYSKRARLYLKLEPPDCNNAIADMLKNLKVQYDTVLANRILAKGYETCERYDDAIKVYKKMITDPSFKNKELYKEDLDRVYTLKKNQPYVNLYRKFIEGEDGQRCSWNVDCVNEVCKLSISEKIYVSYHRDMGLTEVSLPTGLSQKLLATAKQRGLGIDMSLDLQFYNWFIENIAKVRLDKSATGLCYFVYLMKKGDFNAIQTIIDGFLKTLRKESTHPSKPKPTKR
ncbi:MAG: tetratricopeptide repeat protein [Thermoproteota archaeon]